MHFKCDLLSDEQMKQFATKVGDELIIELPDTATGSFKTTVCKVLGVEIADAGKHPETSEHLTRVTLKLS
jgi:hypothetical protein